MYRCYYCRAVSRAGQKLLRFITTRTVGLNGQTREEIATERPCCLTCQNLLTAGKETETSLLQQNSDGTVAAAVITNVSCVVGRKEDK